MYQNSCHTICILCNFNLNKTILYLLSLNAMFSWQYSTSAWVAISPSMALTSDSWWLVTATLWIFSGIFKTNLYYCYYMYFSFNFYKSIKVMCIFYISVVIVYTKNVIFNQQWIFVLKIIKFQFKLFKSNFCRKIFYCKSS